MQGCTTRRRPGTGSKQGVLRTFLRIVRDVAAVSPPLFALSFVVMIISSLAWPFTLLVLTRMYDAAEGLPGGAIGAFALMTGLYLALNGFSWLFGNVIDAISEVLVMQKAGYRFAMRLSEHAARLGLLSFEDPSLLDTLQRAKNAEKNQNLLEAYNAAIWFLSAILSAVTVVGILTSFSFWLLPIALCAAAPAFINKMLRGADMVNLRQRQGKKTRVLDYLWKTLCRRESAREMQVMGFGGYLRGRWRKKRAEVTEEEYAVRKKDGRLSMLCDGIAAAGFCAGVVFSAALVLSGRISAAQFAACVNGFDAILANSEWLLQAFGNFYEHVSCSRHYYEFLDIPAENAAGEPFEGLRRGIEFEDVSFAYPGGGRNAVDHVSFTVRPGEKVALLGVNGSGKTTLTKLLCGVYPPGGGSGRYDGVPVERIDRASLFSTLSLVSQSFVKYSLSLRENVGISNPDAMGDDGAVTEALRGAGIESFAPGELDMQMGREFGGRDLSVGQWQKLAIARGLFRDYSLIVLDEPTSALDPLVESEILKGLLNSAEGRTAVIVSHRVGICRHVDRIHVMDAGRIVESGSHEELMRSGGYYSRLFSEQAKWYA